MPGSQTTSAETLLARLRERYPEASEQELREKLARMQRGRETIERIGERFAAVPQEEIEREAVNAVREARRAPEWHSKETSADAILERAGGRRMSPEEFDKQFGDLPTDGEG